MFIPDSRVAVWLSLIIILTLFKVPRKKIEGGVSKKYSNGFNCKIMAFLCNAHAWQLKIGNVIKQCCAFLKYYLFRRVPMKKNEGGVTKKNLNWFL